LKTFSPKSLIWPLLLIGATLLILAVTIKLSGQSEVLEAYREFWRGSFGTPNALAVTATRTAILTFYALGIALSFQAGIINIGAEGQSRIGAIIAGALGTGAIGAKLAAAPVLTIPGIIVASTIAGCLWSLVAGILRYWRGVPEVISTLMLNLIALLLARYLLSDSTLLRGATIFQQSDNLPDALQFSRWNNTEFHSGILLLFPAVLLCHVYLFHTRGGFAIRAIGANPIAAEVCGIKSRKTGLITFGIAGAFAGLGGAIGILSYGQLTADPTYPDYGFMAIAVALVADLKPLRILPSAILFAGLEVGTRAMERNAGVSHEVVYLIEGMIILAVLVRNRAGALEISTSAAQAAE
jgi:simple sugar transport system permease protein